MEMSLFKKGGKTYTRFKVKRNELVSWSIILECKYDIRISKPIKQSTRFIYFEKEGDLINGQ